MFKMTTPQFVFVTIKCDKCNKDITSTFGNMDWPNENMCKISVKDKGLPFFQCKDGLYDDEFMECDTDYACVEVKGGALLCECCSDAIKEIGKEVK